LLPAALLSFILVEDDIVPDYLGPADEPWLVDLIEEHRRFEGRPRRELAERLREPLRRPAPHARLRMACRVLDRMCKQRPRSAVPPSRVRRLLFGLAANRQRGVEQAVRDAATELGIDEGQVRSTVFADLPPLWPVAPLPKGLSAREVAQRTNLALVQGLLLRATRVCVQAHGNIRPLVRHAHWQGLLCTVQGPPGEAGDDARLEISGPFSLFRRTLVYGRALGRLVSLLPWCDRFQLEATCVIDGREHRLRVRSGDPIFPAEAPRRFDSKVEERFARDFARIAPGWDIVREPAPVALGGGLIFPDFALQHRHRPDEVWWLEVVGFWTPGYLERKLRDLCDAGLSRLSLCIDEKRACDDGSLPQDARIIRYRNRIDAGEVLRLLHHERARSREGGGSVGRPAPALPGAS
jgi:predicted nuclease of restriction endonuclease-like RecB superfamily